MDAAKQQAIFEQLKQLVLDNITDDFDVIEEDGKIEINTRKEVMVNGRKKPHTNLLSVIPQKQHVGFYFMPVYVDDGVRTSLAPELEKMLKGKSCFHCEQPLDAEREAELAALVRRGVDLYQQKKWI